MAETTPGTPVTPLPRSVLVIAYYFPPMGLSGVQRTLKFVKYLPEFGWQPTVLTVTPTGYYAQDYTLLEEIKNVPIERAGSLDPNLLFRRKGVVKMPSERWRKILTFMSDCFFIPDNKIGWKRKARAAAERLFRERPFDLVFATAPPFTDFLIGEELSRMFNRPLVLDYRDAWHEYPYKYYPTPLHRWRNYVLEKRVLRAASKIITTNRRVKELILKRYKFLSYRDVEIMPQGFDPQDFTDGLAPLPKRSKMRITHAGVFYGDRTPKYFLQAVRKLITDRPELKGSIELCFAGNFHDEHRELIRELQLDENVTMTGYLDHAHCVQLLNSSDLLWLMLDNDTQSPGKLYEYFGARKPVLACVRDGFLQQAVDEAGAGTVVAPDDVAGIAKALEGYYENFRSGELPVPDESIVNQYDRRELASTLSKMFGFLVE
jgi:glycosyltransferase involved in cell wall biosynthesis